MSQASLFRPSVFRRLSRRLAGHWPFGLVDFPLRRSIVSFTFDDFPRSAWREGGPVLARHGAKATYYASGCFCDRTIEGMDYYTRQDALEAARAGHEIAHHTFSHAHAPELGAGALLEDCARNDGFLAELGLKTSRHFAFPYGDADVGARSLLKDRYSTCRGTQAGINGARMDSGLLKAVSLERRIWAPGHARRWIDQLAQRPAWLIFYTHDISDNPGLYGSTPAQLDEALGLARTAGCEILTIGEAFQQIEAAGAGM